MWVLLKSELLSMNNAMSDLKMLMNLICFCYVYKVESKINYSCFLVNHKHILKKIMLKHHCDPSVTYLSVTKLG